MCGDLDGLKDAKEVRGKYLFTPPLRTDPTSCDPLGKECAVLTSFLVHFIP